MNDHSLINRLFTPYGGGVKLPPTVLNTPNYLVRVVVIRIEIIYLTRSELKRHTYKTEPNVFSGRAVPDPARGSTTSPDLVVS